MSKDLAQPNALPYVNNKTAAVAKGSEPMLNNLLCAGTKAYKDGEPCGHTGCLHHVTHLCEGCGRILGRANENC